MRTITFEVEVDDYLPETLKLSVGNQNLTDAPIGRMFLCGEYKDGRAMRLRLMQISSLDGDDGTSRRYFAYTDLPKELRVVKVSNPSDTDVNVVPDGLIDADDKQESVESSEEAAERIKPSTLHKDHLALLESAPMENNSAIIDALNVVKETMKVIAENQSANCNLMIAKHEDLLKHFKQVHEDHNSDCINFAETEQRIAKRIEEEGRIAVMTVNTVGNHILLAMPGLEDRIKECVAHPATTYDTDISPQAMLKALEIVSRTIWSSVKSE